MTTAVQPSLPPKSPSTGARTAPENRGVAVRETADRGRGVFALVAFAPGALVARGRPIAPSPTRTRHSLQLDWNRHALFDEPSCLINHSCDPNTGVRDNPQGGYDFVALRAIAPGDEISFDYATTEYESVAVPECLCGAPACRGRSGGYTFLPDDHPAVRAGLIAGYIARGRG